MSNVQRKNNRRNFERNIAFIDGTKTQTSSRYVELSPSYCKRLKIHWNSMFKNKPDYYTRTFKEFLESLGIDGKCIHSLRHTFSSNHYYLGTPDKKRQNMLGHSSIVMTNDIYTTLDLSVRKEDIISIYGDYYFTPNMV